MRSRSCSALATRSLLGALFFAGCPSGAQDGGPDVSGRVPADEKKEESKEDPGFGGHYGFDEAPPTDDEGEEPVPVVAGDEGSGEGGASPQPDDLPAKRECPPGQMLFEEECRPKVKVKAVVEDREREALEHVQTAKGPKESADAAHELLEQQVAQAQRAEDDLDEILEQLRREKARKEQAKLDEPPGKDTGR